MFWTVPSGFVVVHDYRAFKRCGRPSCRCAKGEKHGPVHYLTRNDGGRTRNIYVPEEL